MPTLKMPAAAVVAAPAAPAAPEAVDAESSPGDEVQAIIVAADFLGEVVADPTVVTSVRTAVEGDDALGATRALGDAFIRALNCELEAEDEGSLEGAMQELLLWVKRECKMDATLVDKLACDLCGGVTRGGLRMKTMGLLYNAVDHDDGAVRYALLNKIISLATAAGEVALIQKTVLPQVDRFLKQWKVTGVEKRETYRRAYEALKTVGDVAGAFAFNVKMLELYNAATPAERVAVHNAAVDAIVQAVRLPKLYRFDTLLELEAVKDFGSMQGDKALLHKLIHIFVQEDLQSFMAFNDDNADLLELHDIDHGIAVDKMRLLTFASLGIESQDLTYAAIAEALNIPEHLVEHWVIRAIGSGLVDAKINQLTSSVAIYRSTQRMFTREEWQPVSERVNLFRAHIGDLLIALRETKLQAQ